MTSIYHTNPRHTPDLNIFNILALDKGYTETLPLEGSIEALSVGSGEISGHG